MVTTNCKRQTQIFSSTMNMNTFIYDCDVIELIIKRESQAFLCKNTKLSISDVWMHLLAVQEVHDGLQDIVSLLDNAAIGWDGLTFDLSKDVAHLPDVVFDLGLETTSHTHKRSILETDSETSQGRRLEHSRETHLTAKMWLRSSMTLLSLFCSSLRKSLASTLSWKSVMG